ncbi:MAG: translation elongation factor Ts [Armatimonadetes bacterium]|nr:translation elongation factor Ts [Armatimonadota bacterium]
MSISASDVKKLRDETDAPMMECKAALEEAGGDMAKAKDILRTKGQAAAAKRAGRSTSEGIAKFVVAADGKSAAGIVVECETDFVAKNDSFKALVDRIASGMLEAGSANADTVIDGKTVAVLLEEAVAVIRENIVLKKSTFLSSTRGVFAVYNHHTGKTASAVEVSGSASNLQSAGHQVAIQTVAFPPSFLKKEDVPKDVIDREIQIETQRAIEEGKPAEIAEKAAQGRVNKEYFQKEVLLEQMMYTDPKKSVSNYLAEEGKVGGGPIAVLQFVRLEVGGE